MNIVLTLKAIQELAPNSVVNILNDEIQWISPETSPITDEELFSKIKELESDPEFISNRDKFTKNHQ